MNLQVAFYQVYVILVPVDDAISNPALRILAHRFIRAWTLYVLYPDLEFTDLTPISTYQTINSKAKVSRNRQNSFDNKRQRSLQACLRVKWRPQTRDRPPTPMRTRSAHGRRQLSCFIDGTVWLIRVPRVNGSIPQSIIDYLICSEYATLKFLETTKVPAPRAFDYGIAEDENNKVGVSYIFLEEMAGRAWNSQGPHGKRSADGKDKERDWNGLDDILIELKRHPFPKAVSLLPGSSPSKPIVSAVASERFLVLGPSGPFSTAKDYYTSFVEHNMALIADRQLFTSFPVNTYLVFLSLKSQIQDLTSTSNHDLETMEQFYLKHVDDKGDHLIVDDELNIVGIIDWQMAQVVPASEAFGPSLVTV